MSKAKLKMNQGKQGHVRVINPARGVLTKKQKARIAGPPAQNDGCIPAIAAAFAYIAAGASLIGAGGFVAAHIIISIIASIVSR